MAEKPIRIPVQLYSVWSKDREEDKSLCETGYKYNAFRYNA